MLQHVVLWLIVSSPINSGASPDKDSNFARINFIVHDDQGQYTATFSLLPIILPIFTFHMNLDRLISNLLKWLNKFIFQMN